MKSLSAAMGQSLEQDEVRKIKLLNAPMADAE